MIINPIFFTGSQDDDGIIDTVNIRNPWFDNPHPANDVIDWESQKAQIFVGPVLSFPNRCIITQGGYIRQTVKISGGHKYCMKIYVNTIISYFTLTFAFDAGAEITRLFTVPNTYNEYKAHYEYFTVPDNATEMTFTIAVRYGAQSASVDDIQCVRCDAYTE